MNFLHTWNYIFRDILSWKRNNEPDNAIQVFMMKIIINKNNDDDDVVVEDDDDNDKSIKEIQWWIVTLQRKQWYTPM